MDINKLAHELDNLVNSFLVKAQTVEYGASVKDMLLEKFKDPITNDAMAILQKISDDMWNKSETSFGYFEVDVKVAIKNKNVVLGFVLSPNLSVNKDNNQIFVKQLNAKLPGKYNGAMTKTIKNLKDVPNLALTLFQMSGSV